MSLQKNVLTLDSKRSIISGSEKDLCDAIRRGADLRIYTTFRHNEHLDPNSDDAEFIKEISQFSVTYLIDDNWTAGTMTWRQPITPLQFGPASMSFFLYNQDGSQACARPYLDGQKKRRPPLDDDSKMPRYHPGTIHDQETNAPSRNFIYDFDEFRYFVRDDWQEVLSHTEDGTVISGSADKLAEEFEKGAEIKVGISGLCDDLAKDQGNATKHEVFVAVGSGYHYTEQKLFVAATHHLVRIAPAAPLVYESKNWDFGWTIVWTNGLAVKRICDPRTLKFTDSKQHYAIRWFVR